MSSQSEAQGPGTLAGEQAARLAKRLDELVSAALGAQEVRDLLDGLDRLAASVTGVLDELRECPVLREREHDLELLTFQTIHSKLEQAAAASEDLQVTVDALCRLLPEHAPRRKK